jgi:hypothetical protein
MSNQSSSHITAQTLRNGQVIIAALFAGVAMFGVIVLFLEIDQGREDDEFAVLSVMMASFSLLLALARAVVPAVITRSACKKLSTNAPKLASSHAGITPEQSHQDTLLAQSFLTKTILSAAVLEAAAFCNLVAYMLESQWYSLALGALFACGIWLSFPTRASQQAWFETCQRAAEESRDLAGSKAVSER